MSDLNQYTGDFWKRDETLGEHLERRGIDRREFLGWCAKMAVLMG
jgi:hydrogenase small subunit